MADARLTQTPRDLIRLADDEQVDAVVLTAELAVQVFFKLLQRRVLLSRNCNGRRLITGGVDFDLVLE